MKKLIASLATNCLVISVMAPAMAQLTPTGVGTVTQAQIPQPAASAINSASTTNLNNGITANVIETTNTSVGKVLGASTASVTNVQVANPTQTGLPSLSQPTQVVQNTGGITVGGTNNQQSTQVNANANLGLGVSNLAQVNICLNGSATLGSPNGGSVANCPQSVEAKKVPEPTTIGGLAFMAAYLISRRQGKASQLKQRLNPG